MKILNLIFLAMFLFMIGCSDDPVKEDEKELQGFAEENTILLVNEGQFNASNGSIHFIDAAGMVQENIFAQVNGNTLGDIVQSYTKADTIGVIVVNNSKKVELVQAETFKSLATLTDQFSYPREAIPVGTDKIYVSNGNLQGQVHVIEKGSLSRTNSIDVGYGPEAMLESGSKVYVANSGGWGTDSTLSVIDTNTEQISATLRVGHNPVALVEGDGNTLWVLCKGVIDYSGPTPLRTKAASVVQVAMDSGTILNEIVLIGTGSNDKTLDRLGISSDKSTLYYLESSKLIQLNIDSVNPIPELLVDGNFYGLDVRDDELWLTELNFTGAARIFVYDKSGAQINTYQGGIGSNGVYFN